MQLENHDPTLKHIAKLFSSCLIMSYGELLLSFQPKLFLIGLFKVIRLKM
jgi:hypothetical protein